MSRPAPSSRRISPAVLSLRATAMRRCSVDTYSSPRAVASSPAWVMTFIIDREVVGWVTEEPDAPGRAATAAWARWLIAARLAPTARSEEHTSELQSRGHLVCRLLLEKKKKTKKRRKRKHRQNQHTPEQPQ